MGKALTINAKHFDILFCSGGQLGFHQAQLASVCIFLANYAVSWGEGQRALS